jgi:hypothetical protein
MPRKRRRDWKWVLRKSLPWLGLVATVWLILVPVVWSLFVFFVPWVPIIVVSVLVFALWVVIAWDSITDDGGAIFLCCAGAGGVAFLAAWGLAYLTVNWTRSHYLEASGLKAKQQDFAGAGQIKKDLGAAVLGKVVVLESLNGSSYHFSPMQFELPGELMPSSDAEVGTVVLISYGNSIVGHYTSGTTASQWQAWVQCLDYPHKTLYYSNSFSGSAPPRAINLPQEGEGHKPTAQIRDWLLNLPRHPLGPHPQDTNPGEIGKPKWPKF